MSDKMSDKILKEAFDKLKAIEESEDPFCIGVKDDVVEAYTEVAEDDFDAEQKSGYPGDNDDDESLEQHKDNYNKGFIDEPMSYDIETDTGDNYSIEFQKSGTQTRAFVEANGITIAAFTMDSNNVTRSNIVRPDALLDMLTAAMKAADGSGR
jgi:hypothetical protein